MSGSVLGSVADGVGSRRRAWLSFQSRALHASASPTANNSSGSRQREPQYTSTLPATVHPIADMKML